MNKRKQLLNFSDLMQKKQPPKELPPSSQNIMATILQSMPKEASITKIEYEGPRIALYTNSPRYLLENNETISTASSCVKDHGGIFGSRHVGSGLRRSGGSPVWSGRDRCGNPPRYQ